MEGSHLIIRDEEFRQLKSVLRRILLESHSKVVFLVDKNGQLLCSVGEEEGYDTMALSSLAAGNIAASGGLARLIGEKEFSILFHQGEKDNMHISLIDNRVILVVIFDARTPVGLVRLRVKKSNRNVLRVLEEIDARLHFTADEEMIFEELTDEDIDKLFK
ncbi:MAG: roadblock/LC7 domain-containing protein [Deltaproteobacteria bacterium]|nr:roadblock/LC7 domain-containing protein [Deltaproteobacteria bacterium]NIS76516.1 roadblock/LC7 domain-containing protein [Deltaproteobacteria bacterium]